METLAFDSNQLVLRRRIYDPLHRVLHWMLALSIIGLSGSGFLAGFVEPGDLQHQFWIWHIKMGYVLSFNLGARLLWGVIGPRFALLKDLCKFFAPKSHAKFKPQFGHDPKAALLYILLFIILSVLILTGFSLAGIQYFAGPLRVILFDDFRNEGWIHKIHLYGSYFVICFIWLHVGAISWHQYKSKLPMFSSMINGYQYRRKHE